MLIGLLSSCWRLLRVFTSLPGTADVRTCPSSCHGDLVALASIKVASRHCGTGCSGKISITSVLLDLRTRWPWWQFAGCAPWHHAHQKVDGLVSPENRLRGDPVAQLGPRSATPKLDASQIHIFLPCVFGLHAAFMPAHSPRFAQLHGSDQEPSVIGLTKNGLLQITCMSLACFTWWSYSI